MKIIVSCPVCEFPVRIEMETESSLVSVKSFTCPNCGEILTAYYQREEIKKTIKEE